MTRFQTILGIETSCDETAAAVIVGQENQVKLLSNIVASSASLQAKYGGIIPEQAAREQLKSIIPVIQEALLQAFPSYQQGSNQVPINALAVTQGPGLIGSLLIGVETAKTLSLVWNKPLIPINHLLAHFYANWIDRSRDYPQAVPDLSVPDFPIIGLLVSGGHTDLVLMENHGKYQYLGGTRDDAAGECFDKCARLLGLSYPGGPALSQLAQQGTPEKFKLPRPMLNSGNFDFSFSGLKTAVGILIEELKTKKGKKQLPYSDLAASIEEVIADILVKKTIAAAKKYNIEQIMVAGGVAANKKLGEKFQKSFNGKIFIPPPYLCTDNGATIAAAAYFNPNFKNPLEIQASPGLSLAKEV